MKKKRGVPSICEQLYQDKLQLSNRKSKNKHKSKKVISKKTNSSRNYVGPFSFNQAGDYATVIPVP